MMVEMELVEIVISGTTGHQVIFLQEKEGSRNFPIFIGLFEADAMDDAVKGSPHTRPMTHDLILNCIRDLGGDLTGVYVDELRNDVFHGKLLVRDGNGETIRIDTRPSDAIVLAAKANVPIYVAEDVLSVTTKEDDDS